MQTKFQIFVIFCFISAVYLQCPPSSLSPVISDNPPQIDASSGIAADGTLTIVVNSQEVYNRSEGILNFVGAGSQCNPSTISSLINCTQYDSISVPPGASFTDCGFTSVTSNGNIVYNGIVEVTFTETLFPVRGETFTRTNTQFLYFSVTYQVQGSYVFNSLIAVAPVDLLAALTSVVITSAGPAATATLILDLENGFIFKANSAEIEGPSFLANVTITQPAPVCDQSLSTTSCAQSFPIAITPGTACNISGTYNVTIDVVCSTGNSQCPLGLNQFYSAFIVFTLSSDNFCTVVTADSVVLTATIQTYSDAAHTDPRNNFVPGVSTVYLIIDASATDSKSESLITILSTTITGISIIETGYTPQIIYSNSVEQGYTGIVTAVGTDSANATFPLATSLFQQLDADSTETGSITLVISVTYVGAGGKRTTTRSLRAPANTKVTDASTIIVVSGNQQQTKLPSNGSPSPLYLAYLTFISVLLLAIF